MCEECKLTRSREREGGGGSGWLADKICVYQARQAGRCSLVQPWRIRTRTYSLCTQVSSVSPRGQISAFDKRDQRSAGLPQAPHVPAQPGVVCVCMRACLSVAVACLHRSIYALHLTRGCPHAEHSRHSSWPVSRAVPHSPPVGSGQHHLTRSSLCKRVAHKWRLWKAS
jgi:hypothetical protein